MPQRLGPYQLVRHLASGGMAQVTLAREVTSGRYLVLKRIRGEQTADPKLVKMFLEEARLASMLRHPNIVETYEPGTDQGEYFIAMEYVHGADLRRVLAEVHARHDRLPIAQVLTIIGSAAAGLHHAHELCGTGGQPLGLVHRDVSPSNILVGYNGVVKVTDFGIAKATLHTAETKSGTLKGKVAYMSPEQVTGRAMDRRSDVFSLGIVFYEVATARRLFKNDNDFLTMSTIVQGDVPPPSTHRPDLPRQVEKMIMRALETDPRDRYATADELREDIETFMRSIGQRTNANGVADYMHALLGQQVEPWLVDAQEATLVGMSSPVDFDGSDSGIVAPPATAHRMSMPRKLAPEPESLIVRAHEESLASPGGQPYREMQPMASTPRRGIPRQWIVRGAAAIVSVGVLLVIAVKVTGGGSAAVVPPVPPPVTPVVTTAPAVPVEEPPVVQPPPVAQETPSVPAPPPPPAIVKKAAPPPVVVVVKKEPPPTVVVKKAPVVQKTPPKQPPTKDHAWDPNSLFAPK